MQATSLFLSRPVIPGCMRAQNSYRQSLTWPWIYPLLDEGNITMEDIVTKLWVPYLPGFSMVCYTIDPPHDKQLQVGMDGGKFVSS